MKNRAIGIIRVSSVGQRDKYGPAVQRTDLERTAAELEVDLYEVWEYQESATNASDRPEFQEMLERLVEMGKAGAITTVIFGHPDRLGRDGEAPLFHYLYLLEETGKLQVRFARDDCEPAEELRNLKLFLEAFKAQREAQSIKQRTQAGIRKRAEAGKLPTGSRRILGYIYNSRTGKREIDPETNPALRRAGELVMEGYALREVARMVKKEFGVPVAPSTLGGLLSNPAIYGNTKVFRRKYTGGARRKETWRNEADWVSLPDATPPTFTAEEEVKIRAVLEANRLQKALQRTYFYPLRGHVSCSECGQMLGGSGSTRRGSPERFYRHLSADCQAPKRYWSAPRVEAEVWRQVTAFFAGFESVQEALKHLAKQVTSGRGAEILELELRQIDEQIAANKDRISKLSLAWAKGRLTESDYQADVTQAENQERANQRRRQRVLGKLQATTRVNGSALDTIASFVAAGWERFDFSGVMRWDTGSILRLALEEPGGRRVWEFRQRVLDALNIRANVWGNEIKVALGVPVEVVSNLSLSP